MLRHACGYALANKGIDTRSLQAYLGRSNIQNTARYTALASGRFKNFLTGLALLPVERCAKGSLVTGKGFRRIARDYDGARY